MRHLKERLSFSLWSGMSPELVWPIKITVCGDKNHQRTIKLHNIKLQPLISTLIPLVATLMHFIKADILPPTAEPALSNSSGEEAETRAAPSSSSIFSCCSRLIQPDEGSKDAARASAPAAWCSAAFEVPSVWDKRAFFIVWSSGEHLAPWRNPDAVFPGLIKQDGAG